MGITRAIAQLGRAPRLHTRQCFFGGVHHTLIKRLIDEKSLSYSIPFKEQENNSLTKSSVDFMCPFGPRIERIIDFKY